MLCICGCGRPVHSPGARYASDACRVRAWRARARARATRRHQAVAALPEERDLGARLAELGRGEVPARLLVAGRVAELVLPLERLRAALALGLAFEDARARARDVGAAHLDVVRLGEVVVELAVEEAAPPRVRAPHPPAAATCACGCGRPRKRSSRARYATPSCRVRAARARAEASAGALGEDLVAAAAAGDLETVAEVLAALGTPATLAIGGQLVDLAPAEGYALATGFRLVKVLAVAEVLAIERGAPLPIQRGGPLPEWERAPWSLTAEGQILALLPLDLVLDAAVGAGEALPSASCAGAATAQAASPAVR